MKITQPKPRTHPFDLTAIREFHKPMHTFAKNRLEQDLKRPFTAQEVCKEAIKWRTLYPFEYNGNIDSIPKPAGTGLSHFLLLKTAQQAEMKEHEFDALVKLVSLEKKLRISGFGQYQSQNAMGLLKENNIPATREEITNLYAKTRKMATLLEDNPVFNIATINSATRGSKHGQELAMLMMAGFSDAYDTTGTINEYLAASLRRKKVGKRPS